MKSLGVLLNALVTPAKGRNTRLVIRLVVGLAVLVAIYTVIFHLIMAHEDRSYSWLTGVYWTFTVMTTLGFGDITFESDWGKLFSLVVMLTGAFLILVILPFVFIQFVFRPWLNAREANRVPRKVPESMRDHVILTQFDPVAESLIRRLEILKIPYVIVVESHAEAFELGSRGYKAMLGSLDDPATYAAARAQDAALVVATRSDMTNTNIVFTVSEFDPDVRTAATSSTEAATEILVRAGCDTVLRPGYLLGRAMAQRVLGIDARSRSIGEFGDLVVAEANAKGTALAGVTIAASSLRSRCGVNLVGIWRHGDLELPEPNLEISDDDVLILVGSRDQLDAYDTIFGLDSRTGSSVIVVGGGRVGRAAADSLAREGVRTRIIELRPERIRDAELYVQGDASQLAVLKRAGFYDASAILITTHDDDANIYLTIYCRQLAPDMQVIARSNVERNVATLQRAGADAVLSYASQGSTAILNAFGDADHLVLAEGLEMFSVPVSEGIAGRTLVDLRIPEETGCNIVGITQGGHTTANPDPREPIPWAASLVVIGSVAAERRFLERFPLEVGQVSRRRSRGRRVTSGTSR